MRAATEAVIEPLSFVHGEGRRLLVMEGAKSLVLPPLTLQTNAPTYHSHQPDAGAKLV